MSDTKEEKMCKIQEKLELGVREIYNSQKYKDYISTMSKFYKYSLNNCILIASQCPTATLVCGFKKWQTDFNRTVNKGEKGIMIIIPVKIKTEIEEIMYDNNGKVVRDADGNAKKEKIEREFQSFKPAYVFDVAQTSGEPLPTLVSVLTESVEEYEKLKNIIIGVSPVKVSFEDIEGAANGYYSPDAKKIVIDKNLPQLQTIKTLIHEIAHATLEHGSKADKWDRQTKEVQAESVAYWVSQVLGLDTSEYSFGYISGWSKDKKTSELKENLELIKNVADKISTSIEEKLISIKELEKSKEIESVEKNIKKVVRKK